MDIETPGQALGHDEVELRALLRLLWAERWLIAIVVAICGSLATAAAFLVPKSYDASILLSPVTNTPGGGSLGALGSIASQFSGLASLAGLSVGGDSKKSESIAVLQSEELTETYIQNNNLLPVLFYKKWDSAKKTWTVTDSADLPTLWKANRLFEKSIRKVATNAKTGLVTLTITWRDPNLAAKWANGLAKATNDFLRAQAITESERNITYLNSEAAKTTVVEARQAIYSILQTEIDKAMIARGNEEFAFKILDPAVPPEKPSFPQKALWITGGIVGGLVLAIIIVIVRHNGR